MGLISPFNISNDVLICAICETVAVCNIEECKQAKYVKGQRTHFRQIQNLR